MRNNATATPNPDATKISDNSDKTFNAVPQLVLRIFDPK
jgi:hypothetical protein